MTAHSHVRLQFRCLGNRSALTSKPYQKHTYLFRSRSFIAKHGVLLVYVQSPAVATQHLRPAGLGHVNPTTASAWPVLPALPCGEQSKHHVTRTSEARPRDWWAERAFAPGTNPTLACALGRPRRPRSTLWAAGHGVAWLGAAIDSRRVSPPERFSLRRKRRAPCDTVKWLLQQTEIDTVNVLLIHK